MMDDLEHPSASSAPTFAQQIDASSREMLLEYDDRATHSHLLPTDKLVFETASGGKECHDIPIDTPRFLSIRATSLPPTNGAAIDACPDTNTDGTTESDLSSLPSGSNSHSNSGRLTPILLTHPVQNLFGFIAYLLC
jgi:hypothetical protein